MTPHDLPGYLQAVAPFINNYGYLAVGFLITLEDFGLPVPGETTLIAAAFFAGAGQLNIVIVFIIALVAAIIGDSIGFMLGHYGGHPLLERYGKYIFLTPKRLRKAEAYFNSHGGRIVIIARFIDGLRQINGLIAGISEMRWSKFIVFNTIGASLWVGLWSSVGYLGGSHIKVFLRFDLYITIVFILAVIAYIVYLRNRQHSE
jgi:membrane protein DedA with SNARE-associated domain